MHHKVFIIDEKIVITGSFNFSAGADESNDENVVIIEDPALAKAFMAEFQRVYSAAKR
jgi:phosphatidylserine/phosphatidylglycerophosphate/cardiolipin synthase-like enzyme